MSIESLAQFHRRVAEQPELQQALDGVSDADLPERLSALGAEAGLEFSPDEVRKLMQPPASGPVELTDEEMTGVAGGFDLGTFSPTTGYSLLTQNLRALSVDRRAFPGDIWLPKT